VWTTTPWTLPANQFVAINPDIDYSFVVDRSDSPAEQRLIVATALIGTISAKFQRELLTEQSFKGIALLNLRYFPPFDYFYDLFGQTIGTLTDLTNKSLEAQGKDIYLRQVLRTSGLSAETAQSIYESYLAPASFTEHIAWRVTWADF